MDRERPAILDCHLLFFDARRFRYPVFETRAAGRGLACEREVFSPQLRDFALVAAAYPDIQFVLPTMGWPLDLTEDGRKDWKRALTAISASRNVA